jgi:lysine 2,3-aminomutase
MKDFFIENTTEKPTEMNEVEEPPSKASTEHVFTVNIESYQRIDADNYVISDKVSTFINQHFPRVKAAEWNNWQWQISNSYTNMKQLNPILAALSVEFDSNKGASELLPLRITPYYASLLYNTPVDDPVRRTVVPTALELEMNRGEILDPLSEENYSPVPNLVHRYPDRVLFLATGFCSAYCRYCTRTHMVAKDKCHVGKDAWEPALQYISQHSEIRDVIVSGGDPLSMSDKQIDYLLMRLRSIEHIEIIRIGTKIPVVLPMRITPALVAILKKYHPLFMSIHFSHPDELTPEVKQACERLADAGVPLGSQTVLLKGVNDSVEIMKRMMQGLLKMRVRPYYLYQCDPIPGSMHFRTPVSKGIEIIKGLRGFTSGYAVPQFVIDAPGGGGKIPLLPDYFQGFENGDVLLKNYQDKYFRYPDVL